MKKRIIPLVISIFFILSVGCSSADKGSNLDRAPGEGFFYGAENQEVVEDHDQNQPRDVIRKIIKNGSLNLEANDVDKAYANILSHAIENGGYEFSHRKTDRNGYMSIEAVIKISPEKLDDLMSYAGSVAVIINSATSSDDITDEYYDIQLSLETKRKALESYYKLLENTKELNDILKIQAEINKLIEEIEVSEGKIRLWDQLVSESRLSITINEVNDPFKPKKQVDWSALSFSDMGTIIKNGFTTVSNIIVAIFQWVIIILASISPLILIAGIILVVLRLKKKNKGKELKDFDKSKEFTEDK